MSRMTATPPAWARPDHERDTCIVCGGLLDEHALTLSTGERVDSLECLATAETQATARAAHDFGVSVQEYRLAVELRRCARKLKEVYDRQHPDAPLDEESFDEGRDAWTLLAELGHPR